MASRTMAICLVGAKSTHSAASFVTLYTSQINDGHKGGQ